MVCVSLLYGAALAVSVFDCEDHNTRFMEINLLQPAKCPDPVRDYLEPIPINVQVVQTDTDFPITAFQCQVIYSVEVCRCGHNSWSYGCEFPIWQRVVDLSPEECRSAALGTGMRVENVEYFPKIGVTEHHRYFTRGSRKDGTCQYQKSFVTAGKIYSWSQEEYIVEITVSEVRGIADGADGHIRLNNGLRVPFRKGFARDNHEGLIVWNTTDIKCEDSVSQVYLGKAEVYHLRNQNRSGSIIMVQNNVTFQVAGLVMQEDTTLCHAQCHDTHVDGIAVCVLQPGQAPVARRDFQPLFDAESPNLLAQIAHSKISAAMSANDRFATVQAKVCQVELKTIHNKLQAISGADNKYALLDVLGIGHVIHTSGNVVYVSQCVEKVAATADYTNCTEEIPVSVNNVTMFVDPFTWVLQEVPTVVPCNPIMPVKWRIEGNWYASTPHLILANEPSQLSPESGNFTKDFNFAYGLGRGLFTKAQLTLHRLYMRQIAARRPVVNQLTIDSLASADTTGRLFGIPISVLDLEDLKMQVAFFVMPAVRLFGRAWTIISGLLLVCALISLLVSAIVRMIRMYLVRGMGWWIPAAAFSTVFAMLTLPVNILKKATRSVTDPEPFNNALVLQDVYQELTDLKQQLEEVKKKKTPFYPDLKVAF